MKIFCNVISILQFDISFPSIPCTLLSVDTTDISGEKHHDIVCSLSYLNFRIISQSVC
jgi:hypothetical protein